jgi:hypothetical protein
MSDNNGVLVVVTGEFALPIPNTTSQQGGVVGTEEEERTLIEIEETLLTEPRRYVGKGTIRLNFVE